MLWEIRPVEKKNVFQRTSWIVGDGAEMAAGKTFYMEEWYRWGRCIVESDTEPTVSDEPYTIPFELSDYEVQDQESDDGCTLDFVFPEDEGWTEEEKQFVQDLWDEGAWSSLEENDMYTDDCDTEYYGPLEIVCIDSTPSEKPKATGGWPF